MYCIKCGAKLPEEAKFCHECGSLVFTGEPGQARQPAQEPRKRKAPVRRRKRKAPLLVGFGVLAVLIAVFAVGTAMGWEWKGLPNQAGGILPLSFALDKTQETVNFLRYENKAVCFALDYPEGFAVSEPYGNNVLISKESACIVAAEYAFQTTKGCYIYSAKDFAGQVEQEPTVLSDWIGAETLQVTQTGVTEGGAYFYGWTLNQSGKNYIGGLYIFDGQGALGCYTLQWMVEDGTQDSERYQALARQMVESFTVTGAYQPQGYTLHEAPDAGLRFVLQDDLLRGRLRLDGEDLMAVTSDTSFMHGCIEIGKYSAYRPDTDTVEETLIGGSGFFLNYKDNAQFASQVTPVPIGRYDYTELDVEYYEDGVRHVACQICFPYGNDYWKVVMRSSEENLSGSTAALVNVLSSLCFQEGEYGRAGNIPGPSPAQQESRADNNQVIEAVLRQVEATEGFVQPDSYYQPLASFTDVDGNGTYELLVVYKVKQPSNQSFDEYKALYDVYAVKDGVCTAVTKGNLLYLEVGGNSGTLGLAVDKAKAPYLVVSSSSPQGDRFNNTVRYIPFSRDQRKLEKPELSLEAQGVYGEEDQGSYWVNGSKTGRADFEARQTEFQSLWTDLNLNRGPGNGGNNMSFTQIRELDMNTYTFASVG